MIRQKQFKAFHIRKRNRIATTRATRDRDAVSDAFYNFIDTLFAYSHTIGLTDGKLKILHSLAESIHISLEDYETGVSVRFKLQAVM